MEEKIFDLYELQTKLKTSVEGAFARKVWVKAEISSLKYREGGHCYIELSQSDGDKLIAKIQANIWKSKYYGINNYFRQVTGMSLQAGISVLLYAQITYSQLYGLSLNVDSIDPTYTLGERERVRRETMERLQREGLMDRQKKRPPVTLPRRIAVISAPDAAGFGDFMKHLRENPYGFTFGIELFESLMQGASCPDSIISALEDISQGDFDIVLIMRGGGSELDLACFDDYRLCSGIAKFPLPIFTAIGHERDYHVADMVAYQSVKTPTALAELIVDWYADEDRRILDCASRLKMAFNTKISNEESRVASLENRIRSAMKTKFSVMESRIDILENRIRSAVRGKLSAMESRVAILEGRINSAVKSLKTRLSLTESQLRVLRGRISSGLKTKISTAENRVIAARTQIQTSLRSKISAAQSRLSVLETKIHSSDPRKIIERGYILALDESGVAMKRVSGRKRGDKISLMFTDGTMKCTVDDVINNKDNAF